MKHVVFTLSLIVLIGVGSANTVTFAQGGNNQSNGTLKMIKSHVPDSVIFTVATGKEIDYVKVSLIGGDQTFEGSTYVSGKISLKTVNGKMVYSYGDQTTLTAKDFKAPSNFEPQKIKFETDNKEMYYDLTKSSWVK